MDTGPVVAYFSRREANHQWATEQFETLELPFITCEPVITEVSFLAARHGQQARLVLELISRGVLKVGFRLDHEIRAIQSLIQRYANVPMSLADACLVRLAEVTRLPICTLDRDFAIYRAHGRHPLKLIMPDYGSLHEP